MQFFTQAKNTDLDPDFAEYLGRFKNHLMTELQIEDSNLLEMVLSKEANSIDLFTFLNNDDLHMGNTLYNMLLRDYDIECGIQSNGSLCSQLNTKFDVVGDQYNRAAGRASDILTQFGSAGLFNSFHINNEGIRKELCSLSYESMVSTEYFAHDDDIQVDFISDYMCLAARLIMINPVRREHLTENIISSPHQDIFNMANYDFIEKTMDEKKTIVDNFFVALTEMKQDEAQRESEENDEEMESEGEILESVESNMKEVFRSWPIELIRACIISGYSEEEAIGYGSEIIEILLEKLGYEPESIELKKEEMIKSALLPFPESYKAIFGSDMPDPKDAFSVNRAQDDGFGSWPYLCIGFENTSGYSGLSSGMVRALNSYGDYAQEALNVMIESRSMTQEALADVCKRHSVLRPGQAEMIASKWLDDAVNKARVINQSIPLREQVAHSSSLYKSVQKNISLDEFILDSIKKSESEIRSIGSDSLNLKINQACLDIILEDKNSLEGFKFIFSNDDQKDMFALNELTGPDKISKKVIDAGSFSQKQISEHWRTLDSGVKKSVINYDFGI